MVYDDPFPFVISSFDPTTVPGQSDCYQFTSGLPMLNRWYWNMLKMRVQLSLTLTGTYDDPTSDFSSYYEDSFSYDETIDVVPTGMTVEQRAGTELFLPSFDTTGRTGDPTISPSVPLRPTFQMGLFKNLIYPSYYLASPTIAYYPLIMLPSGLYAPSFCFSMTAAGYGLYSDAVIVDLPFGFTSCPPNPAPGNSSFVDPSDPSFTGGIEWGSCGSGSVNDIDGVTRTFQLYGFSGPYVAPAGSSMTGSLTTLASLTLTPQYE
jgi:hypothetical protein